MIKQLFLVLFYLVVTSSALQVISLLGLESGENNLNCVLTYGNYSYYATNTSPSTIVKVDYKTLTRVGSITLAAGENSIRVGIAYQNFAYFATGVSGNNYLVKVDLSNFTRISSILFSGTISNITTGLIYGSNAYLGTWTTPGYIVQINLLTFTKGSTISFSAGENSISSSVLINNIGYFTLYGTSVKIVTINMDTFTRINGSYTALGSSIYSSATDGNYMVAAGADSSGTILRASFSPDFSSTVAYFNQTFTTSLIYQNFGYFSTSTGLIYQIDLSTMKLIHNDTSANPLSTATLVDHYAYYGALYSPGQILKVDILNDCAFAVGGTLLHNTTRVVYSKSSNCGTCSIFQGSISCYAGTLSGNTTFTYSACNSILNCTCDNATGGSLAHNTSRTVYQSNFTCPCTPGSILCLNGALYGNTSYSYLNCPNCDCDNATGGALLNGDTRTVFPSNCSSVCTPGTIYCIDGSISGNTSWTFLNCSTNCGCGNLEGYLYPYGSCGSTCQQGKGLNKCENGVLIGNYSYLTCVETCETVSLTSSVNATLNVSNTIVNMFFPESPNVTVTFSLATNTSGKIYL